MFSQKKTTEEIVVRISVGQIGWGRWLKSSFSPWRLRSRKMASTHFGMDIFEGEFFEEGRIIGKMWETPWDGGPLIINPIYTLYRGYLLGI